MIDTRLNRVDAAEALGDLKDKLGSLARQRLSALVGLADDAGQINLGAALAELFPGRNDKTARTYFHNLAAELASEAEAAGSDLRLRADNTRQDPSIRWCWFEGTLPRLRGFEAAQRLVLARDEAVANATEPIAFVTGRATGSTYNGSSTALDSGGRRYRVVDVLMDWAQDRNGRTNQQCALLGELGSGKTTTARLLVQRLFDVHKNNRTAREPVYVDLSGAAPSFIQTQPTFEQLLRHVYEASPGHRIVDADTLLEIIYSGNAVLIVDGLDEVLVHLTSGDGMRFIRTIWNALIREPDAYGENDPTVRSTKLLVTCRSHCFRSVADEIALLADRQRDVPGHQPYLTLTMAPFDEAMVRDYFRRRDIDPDMAMNTIEQVHDLSDLATRPMTLRMIVEQIDWLREKVDSGQAVTGVNLYDQVVTEWLERDRGKHSLEPNHKLRLMEELAAQMARNGTTSWTIDDVEQCLIDSLEQPSLAMHYVGQNRAILKTDLRTATFLVRADDDSSEFRFAHTSFREYFTARYLMRTVQCDDPGKAWAMPIPRDKTLDFLGQLLLSSRKGVRQGALAGLKTIHDTYAPQSSELAFAYALRAIEAGYPAQSLAGTDLRGADLAYRPIGETGATLNLRQINFAGADLKNARFSNCDLSFAIFSEADMTRTILEKVNLTAARFDSSKLVGTIFRRADLDQVSVRDARLDHCHFRACENYPSWTAADDEGCLVTRLDSSDVQIQENQERQDGQLKYEQSRNRFGSYHCEAFSNNEVDKL